MEASPKYGFIKVVLGIIFSFIIITLSIVIFRIFNEFQDTNHQLDRVTTELTTTKEILSQTKEMLSQTNGMVTQTNGMITQSHAVLSQIKDGNDKLIDDNAKLGQEMQDAGQASTELSKSKEMLAQAKDDNSKLINDNTKLKQELQGWDILLNTGTSPATVGEYFFDLDQKIHDQIHKFANKCIDDMSQLSPDQKIKWCQDQIQGKIESQKEKGINSNIAFYQQQLAACNDSQCKEKEQKQIDQLQEQDENNMDKLKSDLDDCQNNAEQILKEQCNRIDSVDRLLDKRLNVNRDPNL